MTWKESVFRGTESCVTIDTINSIIIDDESTIRLGTAELGEEQKPIILLLILHLR